MELKTSQRKSQFFLAARQVRLRRTKRYIFVILYTFLIFAVGYYVHRSGFSFGRTYRTLRHEIEFMPRRLRAVAAQPETERIVIDINHDDYMRLAYQREIALIQDMLIVEERDFVPATVKHKDESVEAMIRLKGDALDHLQEDKWSFRIRVRGDDTLFGMKEFSIQHPQTRNYIYEWICNQALRREGVPAIRYEFVEVTLNGKDLGVFALEEHFDKHLIENNQLREGPIVRFDESLAWNPDVFIWNGGGDFQASDIDAFQTSKLLTDEASYSQYITARNLLESFRRGELTTSDVFDLPKLARYYAIVDLMGDEHGNRWTNVRYYYNPITSRLEPIGYDSDCGRPLEALSPVRQKWRRVNEIVFDDLTFYAAYMKELERVSQPSYLDTLLAELSPEIEDNLNIIHSEFPGFDFSREVLYDNRRRIERFLNPEKAVHAFYHQASGSRLELQLGNIQVMPIEVLSVSYGDAQPFRPTEKIILPGSPSYRSEPVNYEIVGFEFPEGFAWSNDVIEDLEINYRVLGTSRIRQETVFPWPYLDDNFTNNDFIRQDANIQTFDFLETNNSTREIIIKAGTWNLDRNLIIPEGYRVLGGEGTQLNLSNSAKILSYSPLELIGSEDQPFVVQSLDSTGQGIVVMSTDETSTLAFSIFRNLSNPTHGGWELTGAVTFYESPVEISHAQFLDSRAEDALNIVRSEFTVDDSFFSHTSFDAIDIDFAGGTIANSSFIDVGNDAVDFSGSIVELHDIFINGAGDKGLSAGENSQIIVNRAKISNAMIAVASKDLSNVDIGASEISDSKYGLAAYQKKSEFGAAAMNARGLNITRVDVPFFVERESSVVVDGEAVEAVYDNVYTLLYGTEQ